MQVFNPSPSPTLRHSPSTPAARFKVSSNGSRPYARSSSSPSILPAKRPTGSPSNLKPCNVPARSNYADAATQYSPMTPTRISPSLDKPNESTSEQRHVQEGKVEQEEGKHTASAVPSTPDPATFNASSSNMPRGVASTLLHSDASRAVTSPSSKRRSSGENLPSPATAAQAGAKRAKSSGNYPKVLPVRYELCEVEDMVILIANMISELIQRNDTLPLRDGVLTRFHSRTPPGISVVDYLQRLAKHATLTPPLLLSMVYYIDRLCALYPAFTVTSLTIHRFLITAATVAAKGLSDLFWNNSTYARVGGVKVAELGLLELEFLYRVDWKIVPNPEVLVDYYRGLVERSEGYVLEDAETADDESDESMVSLSEEEELSPAS